MPFLLACRVSVEKSADNLMGVPLHVICNFSLDAFNILSLSLIFVILFTVHLDVFLLGFICPGTLCTSWTLFTIFFPILGKFSAIISSDIFSDPFSLSSPSGVLIMWMLIHLMLSQRSLRLSSFFCSFFFLYSVLQLWFPPLCLPGDLSILLHQLFCCWFLLVYCSSVCSLLLLGLC